LALPGVNIGGGNVQRRRWRTLRWLGPQRPSRWAKTPPADASIAFSLPPQHYIVLNTW
jgi:hypothetical protein